MKELTGLEQLELMVAGKRYAHATATGAIFDIE